MTMWFDEDTEELVQNRADLHVDVDGQEMRLDLSDEHIREEFLKVAETVEEYDDQEGE